MERHHVLVCSPGALPCVDASNRKACTLIHAVEPNSPQQIAALAVAEHNCQLAMIALSWDTASR